MIPSIVLLGNLLVDDLVFPDGTTRMGQAGGALLYDALGATAILETTITNCRL